MTGDEDLARHVVPDLGAATRLDRYLVEHGLVRTRSQAKSRLDDETILVDGEPRKAGFLLRGGEHLEIRIVRTPRNVALPEDLPLSILYQDDDVVALDKPAGLVVHPAPGAWTGTLVNALLFHGLVDERAGQRPGIVHRLDRETSGVLLVARNSEAHEGLARQFASRDVEKTYLALVLGTPAASEGTLEWSIGRHPRERQRMSIRSRRGRTARTRWRRVESFGNVSLLEVHPETGRTHQIRVHLAAMGHPVLGDSVYGSKKGRALPAEGPARSLGRHALHAAVIVFRHPHTAKRVTVTSPLAQDLAVLVERLRSALGS